MERTAERTAHRKAHTAPKQDLTYVLLFHLPLPTPLYDPFIHEDRPTPFYVEAAGSH